ncbi:MAG: hypothetical protein IT377_10940 [Polyangiaceae bacterium]|nr:hypothetical protein [Polyangiaceae bacterium]
MMRRWLLLFLGVAVAACAGRGHRGTVVAPTDRPLSEHASAPSGRADTAVETLFARLTKPKSANEGARAAAEAFAWAGMATHALRGVTQEAAPPIAPVVTPDFVAYRAAQDYAKGAAASRVSLEQVAEWLGKLGWKPEKHPPGEALALVLRELIKTARLHPEATASFVPLFLARSLKAGGSADAEDPNAPPTELTLTLLDLRLFLGVHLRGMQVGPAAKKKAAFHAPPKPLLAKSLEGPTGGGGASLPTVCSDFLEWMGAKGVITSGLMDVGSSVGIGRLYDRLGIGSGAGAATYWLLRGLDLVLSTNSSNLSFSLHGAPATTHQGTSDGRAREVTFTARVQLMEFTSDVERMARDCAEKMGFDVDTGGRDMIKWRVYWDGDELSELATIPDRNHFDYANPRPGHDLRIQPFNQTTKVGTARLVVDIAKEEEHRPGSPVESRRAWVRAELNRAVAPGLESLFGAGLTGVTGLSPWGLAGDLVFVADGLVKEFSPEVARAYVTVESCRLERQEWTGTIRYRRTVSTGGVTPASTNANGETTSGSEMTLLTETATVTVNGRHAKALFSSTMMREVKTQRSFMQQCEVLRHVFQKKIQISGWAKETSSVSKSANVEAGIAVSPDGSYVVSFTTPTNLVGTHSLSSSESQMNCQGSSTIPGPKLNDSKFSIAGFSGQATGVYSGSGSVSGQRDKTEPYQGGTITEQMQWSFQPIAR